jgi:hypothetical protein
MKRLNYNNTLIICRELHRLKLWTLKKLKYSKVYLSYSNKLDSFEAMTVKCNKAEKMKEIELQYREDNYR